MNGEGAPPEHRAGVHRHGRRLVAGRLCPAELLPQANRYHQQYLFKVPNGYCGIGGTGVSCPVGLTTGES
ncbi:hypothetical protein GCM10011574_02460 [Microbispora bryophytorum]|uniref:Uncharacterized protein n=1 Tax=Microbispora bryophytorum TaxID=1460882 RepID=A0A8H9GTM8_9ACTN|nr:hypothetical protein GCM10011574_02460 [Microbispora bryophytorum]